MKIPALSVRALAMCMCSLPAMASVLFSDLGPPGDVYDSSTEYIVSGSASAYGESVSTASLFTVAGSGSLGVSEIDLAVGNLSGADTFYAAIFTDNSGTPGLQVAGAYWSLSTSTTFGTCCDLVSITGITGVNLTGGDQYFMILGPLSTPDNSYNGWSYNNQGAMGDIKQSFDGGVTWTTDYASYPTGAFDVLTPEPGTLLLLGTGLIGMLSVTRRRKPNRP